MGRGGRRAGSGRKPIDAWTVERVQLGLDEGISWRSLAAMYAISVRTVAHIAAGEHPSQAGRSGVSGQESGDAPLSYVRCPGCGYLVIDASPCLVCAARATRAGRAQRQK